MAAAHREGSSEAASSRGVAVGDVAALLLSEAVNCERHMSDEDVEQFERQRALACSYLVWLEDSVRAPLLDC